MTSAKDTLVLLAIVAGSLLFTLAVVLLVVVLLRGMRRKLQARVEAQIPAEQIVLVDWFANNFGVQSRGVRQLRGNGALLLCTDALRFFMMVGDSELRIPLQAITAVSFVNSHLGKTVGRKLLAIDFTNDINAPDRVALLVREPEVWQQRLHEHTRANVHGMGRTT